MNKVQVTCCPVSQMNDTAIFMCTIVFPWKKHLNFHSFQGNFVVHRQKLKSNKKPIVFSPRPLSPQEALIIVHLPWSHMKALQSPMVSSFLLSCAIYLMQRICVSSWGHYDVIILLTIITILRLCDWSMTNRSCPKLKLRDLKITCPAVKKLVPSIFDDAMI